MDRDNSSSRTEDRNSSQSGSGMPASGAETSACSERTDSHVDRQRAHASRWALCVGKASAPSIKLTKSSAFKWPNILLAPVSFLTTGLFRIRIFYQLTQFF